MSYGYSFPAYNKDTMVRVIGRDIPISTKHSIELCTALRHTNITVAKRILEDAINEKRPIPFHRFTNGLGHKPGMAAGRYPRKACEHFIAMVKSLETNGQHKGLNTSHLVLIHAVANKASRPYRPSRQRGRRMKNTHVELVAREEKKEASKKETSPKSRRQTQTGTPPSTTAQRGASTTAPRGANA